MSNTNQKICAGRTFHLATPPKGTPHLWIILTDINYENCGGGVITETVAIVNLTTKRSSSDTTTILDVGDHRFIKCETVVDYAYAMVVEVNQIKKYIETGYSRFDDDCSEDLLDAIQKGVLESPYTPEDVVDYCQECFRDYW